MCVVHVTNKENSFPALRQGQKSCVNAKFQFSNFIAQAPDFMAKKFLICEIESEGIIGTLVACLIDNS